MNGGTVPSDLRLARHCELIEARFKKIIKICQDEGRLNTSVGEKINARFGLKKTALRVLDPAHPSPTITSMPDDLLHYAEPRTLTVRENARLQSFPDWFAFKGKYTTGGHLRRVEVPRFTQVANAVPPLVARAIGEFLVEVLAPPRTKKQLGRQRLVQRAEVVAQI
jgi:DNA (cytosine-5)-methyltransferase 1